MTLSSRHVRLIAAFVGINVALVAAGWVALVSPQRHDAATAAASAQLVQNQIESLKFPNNTPGGPTKQPAIHTSCLYKLNTALPSHADQPGLLLELQQVAKTAGVKILGVSPLTPQAVATGYTVEPINLNLDGSYFAVTRFLHDLRTLVSAGDECPVAKGPLFGVTSVSFSGLGSDGNATATAGIEAFYYGVTAGATAPPSTTDTTTTTGG
jgi:type IV pilus assembly PilO-like protein